VYFDDRNNIFFPTKGQFIELSNCFYNPVLGSDYRFTNITLDARKYIGLWKENVLALQAFVNMNEGTVPFRLMGALGSDSYMRGYYNGRYRDKNALALQAELRKTIWGPVSIVAFGGCGTVSSTLDGLATQLKPNYGAGLRIMGIPREKLNVRMDYGMGVDGNAAFYLTMGEAF
jgi:outer membrane protein assembly factor BamA